MAFIPSQCIKPFSSKSSRRSCRSSPASSNEPSSPKVGCMGQVRRCKTVSTVAPPPPPKQSSSRGLYFFVSSAAFFFVSPMNCSWSAKAKKMGKVPVKGSRVAAVEEIERPLPAVPVVPVEELDPPLPVAKVGKKGMLAGKPAESLWKRRCRSGKLEELFFCQPERLPAVIAGVVV